MFGNFERIERIQFNKLITKLKVIEEEVKA